MWRPESHLDLASIRGARGNQARRCGIRFDHAHDRSRKRKQNARRGDAGDKLEDALQSIGALPSKPQIEIKLNRKRHQVTCAWLEKSTAEMIFGRCSKDERKNPGFERR